MLRAYRRWRHTRFVQRYRPFAQDQRVWRRAMKAATPGLPERASNGARIAVLVDQLGTGWPDETR